MAAPTSAHHSDSYHDEEESNRGYRDWYSWGNCTNQISFLPVDAYGDLQTETDAQCAGSLIELPDNFGMSTAAFDTRLSRIDGHVNAFGDLNGNSESLPLQTAAAAILDDPFGLCSWETNPAIFSTTLADDPPIFNTNSQSTLNQPFFTDSDIVDVPNNGMRAAEGFDPWRNELLLVNTAHCPVPSTNSSGYTMYNDSIDLPLLDLHSVFQGLSMPVAMNTGCQFPSTPLPSTNTFLFTPASSTLLGVDLSQENLMNVAFQKPPSKNSVFKSYPISSSSITSTRDPSTETLPLGVDVETSVLSAAAMASAGWRPITCRPTVSYPKTTKSLPCRHNKKVGRRQGPLSLVKKEKVSRMRGIACARCWANHVECSTEGVCNNCKKSVTTPFSGMVCHRDHLQKYLKVLSPRILVAHLDLAVVRNLTSTMEFMEKETIVHLLTGRTHPPIILFACEHVAPNEKSLLISDLDPKSHDDMTTFATAPSLPYGLRNYTVDQLKNKCLKHIEAISTQNNIIGDPSTLVYKLLIAICRFQESNLIAKQCDLLKKAIMINRIHYAKGRMLLFSEESASYALENLQNRPANLSSPYSLSARLLSRQIKSIFNLLVEELQKEVIDKFDRELRNKRRDTWPLCLCTYLALCLSVEEIQLAVDGFVQYKKSTEDGGDPISLQRSATYTCGTLENCTLEHSWFLLTGKMSGLKTNNPFRDGYSADDEVSGDESVTNLVNDIRQIMSHHELEITERAADKCFGGSPHTTRDHKDFRNSNPGRLVSKILNELR